MPSDTPPARLLRLSELADELRQDATAAYEAAQSNRPRGPVTGIPDLDQQLGGRLAPGLSILHGGPGIGKTAFGLQVAGQCQFPALYVSCEMSCLELVRRVIARVTGTALDHMRAGLIRPELMMEKFTAAAAACPNLALLDATQAFVGPELLDAAARKVRGDSPHVLVVMDSIHSWTDSLPGDIEEYVALGSALGALRTLARRLDCPILGIAERNRSSMKTGGLHASAGNRKFEYSGEAVIELDEAKDATRTGSGEIPVDLKLSKNRNGARGKTVNLLWHDNYQRFREVPR